MTGGRPSPLQRWAKHAVGLLVTLVCLIVFIRQVDVDDLLTALSNFHWGYLLAGLASLAFGYAMRIFRWSVMLRAAGANTSFVGCSAPFLGSIALNNVLPLRLGDVVRALVFPNSMGISKTTATSSLVVERLIDLMSLLACFAVGIYAIQAIGIPAEIKSSAVTLAAVGGIALSVGFLCSEKLATVFTGLAGKNGGHGKVETVYAALGGLLQGFNAMSRPKILLTMLLISLFVWMGESGLFYFVLLGAGVQSTPITALLVMSFATLSTLVPSSPGYVGPFHLAAFTAITLIGGTAAQAGSAAVIVHMALWLPTTIAGALAIWARPELFRRAQSHTA